ncbi:hypothetical protein MTP99_003124 [Tenebrio molitor]|jgi:hypothetical protein|nr:hypothetical protein MTP99_003124 [Tenebrio molitor]
MANLEEIQRDLLKVREYFGQAQDNPGRYRGIQVKCRAMHERQTEVPWSYSEIQRDSCTIQRYTEQFRMGNSGCCKEICAIYKKIVDRKSRGNRGRIMRDEEKS